MKIAVISSIPPLPTTSGELVLFRHLIQLKNTNVLVVTDHASETPFKTIRVRPWAWYERAKRTRLSSLFLSVENILLNTFNSSEAEKAIKNFNPDMIISVAGGRLQWYAAQTASMRKIPLILFCHDWWPDMLRVPSIMCKWIMIRYLRVARSASVCLCVSEGMSKQFKYSHCRLLYPIPKPRTSQPILSRAVASRTVVTYAGNVSEIYAPPFQDICQYLMHHSTENIELHHYGPTPDWSPPLIYEAAYSGIFKGNVSSDQLDSALAISSFLLVIMSFDPKMRTRMVSSFPSKIPEYCFFGKPILIWGPEYCSAVQWARDSQAAIVCCEESPEALIKTITETRANERRLLSIASAAVHEYRTRFNPQRVQSSFEEVLCLSNQVQ